MLCHQHFLQCGIHKEVKGKSCLPFETFSPSFATAQVAASAQAMLTKLCNKTHPTTHNTVAQQLATCPIFQRYYELLLSRHRTFVIDGYALLVLDVRLNIYTT